MAGKNAELTHAEMWDDSALIESWNEALEEYKKYHSIHAKGGSLEDLELQKTSGSRDGPAADLETNAVDQPEIVDEAKAAAQTQEVQPEAGVATTKDTSAQGGNVPGPPRTGPQGLLGSVQDEGLKRLLMSWYYAGYYTGLYEGQQQGRQ
ncbi:Survival motor neuron-like protein 1 [Colletotrichum trifolii]|uniref:Survival motor neuron-like protein 1 n=1 Tax=Colletotrichum trifolii TaxID=5466 RepID=A0A4V3HW99_COLTR|nr:Survival motor neuron-like protein 1 [Colletotrichum trifolii]